MKLNYFERCIVSFKMCKLLDILCSCSCSSERIIYNSGMNQIILIDDSTIKVKGCRQLITKSNIITHRNDIYKGLEVIHTSRTALNDQLAHYRRNDDQRNINRLVHMIRDLDNRINYVETFIKMN